jgi:hypothetical protein
MKITIPLAIILLCVPAFAQANLNGGVKVNGLGLGAAYRAVVAKFGKPASETTRKGDECVGGRTRTMKYPGLSFDLTDSDGKNFTVAWIEVTSPKWDVSGVKIGDTQAAVKNRFGTRSSEETISGSRVWYFQMPDENPGSSNFYFKAGKVVKIQSGWELC